MRILLILSENPVKRILVELNQRQYIRDIKDLIGRGKHCQAIKIALQEGKLEREIGSEEFENLDTDLILQKDSAHWDVTRRI